jgi:hypothetical protein
MASLLYAPTEYFALKWKAWSYYPDQVLGMRYGAEFETYLFAAAITIITAFFTLTYALKIDRRPNSKNRKH